MRYEADRIDLGGVSLEVARWDGLGVPFLLLHEGLGSVSIWRDFPSRLAQASGRPVVAWSRQGHGQSDRLTQARDMAYLDREAATIPAVMDALGLTTAHFLGHSDGASIALLTAAAYPARVASLIVEAPHVFVEDITLQGIRAAKKAFAETDLPAKLARHHADPAHTFDAWCDTWLDPAFARWNIEHRLPLINAPALLIQGEDDEYGSMEQLRRIAQQLGGPLETLALASCGHVPHRERIDTVLTTIVRFTEQPAAI